MSIAEIHGRLATSVLLFMLTAGVWGLVRWRRKQSVNDSYFGILAVGEVLIIAQVLLGIWMWLGMNLSPASDRPWMHYLYGFVAVLTLPAAYAYNGGSTEEVRDQGLYALVCLFLAGIAWRAMTTASL